MNTLKLTCTACGAPLDVAENATQVTCPYCGTPQVVDRGPGYATLKAADKVSQSIQQGSSQTQAAIHAGTHVTREELQRLQLGQELSFVQTQLATVRSDLRSLQHEKQNRRTKQQIKELQAEEVRLKARMAEIQQTLHPQYVAASSAKKQRDVDPRQTRGCTVGCVTFLVVGTLLSLCAIPLDQVMFGVASGAEGGSGPLLTITSLLAITAGFLAYYYVMNLEAALWKPIKSRLKKPNNTRQ